MIEYHIQYTDKTGTYNIIRTYKTRSTHYALLLFLHDERKNDPSITYLHGKPTSHNSGKGYLPKPCTMRKDGVLWQSEKAE